MPGAEIRIAKIPHGDEAVKRRVFEFLAPHEAENLFILGNLRAGFPESYLYVATRGGEWAGIAAYYALAKSICPFSKHEAALRALARYVAAVHPRIEYINGMEEYARPACEEMEARGYQLKRDPRMAFMEMEGEPPRQEHEGLARPMTEEDAVRFVRLMRHMRGIVAEDAPVTEEELERARRGSALRQVIEVDGRLAATAGTSGIGIEAFQIIGVVTHPDARRKGYASAACASLIRRMAREGAKRCALFTGLENTPAQKCYEKMGFRTTGGYYMAELAAPE
jgi:predicted GNAT family acetyltransferase